MWSMQLFAFLIFFSKAQISGCAINCWLDNSFVLYVYPGHESTGTTSASQQGEGNKREEAVLRGKQKQAQISLCWRLMPSIDQYRARRPMAQALGAATRRS
jgi:hypothetical protein